MVVVMAIGWPSNSAAATPATTLPVQPGSETLKSHHSVRSHIQTVQSRPMVSTGKPDKCRAVRWFPSPPAGTNHRLPRRRIDAYRHASRSAPAVGARAETPESMAMPARAPELRRTFL
jgi:hypothetical protein